MFTFHGNPTAAVTDKLHCRQFALAHVALVNFRRSAERAFLAIVTGVAKVTRVFGDRATSFTGMGHIQPPFSLIGIFDVFPPGLRPGMAGRSVIRIGNDCALSIAVQKAVTGFPEEDVDATLPLRTDTGIDYSLAFRYDNHRYLDNAWALIGNLKRQTLWLNDKYMILIEKISGARRRDNGLDRGIQWNDDGGKGYQ